MQEIRKDAERQRKTKDKDLAQDVLEQAAIQIQKVMEQSHARFTHKIPESVWMKKMYGSGHVHLGFNKSEYISEYLEN